MRNVKRAWAWKKILSLLTPLIALLGVPFAGQAQAPVALDNGLVALLSFENNFFVSGIGGVGQASTVGAVEFAPGVRGNALALHGDDCVEVPDCAAMHAATLTLCAWVCPRQDFSSGRIAEKGSSNSFWLNLASNKVRFGFYADRYYEVDSGTVLKPNEWAFVAGTYDGEALRVYVNGRLEAFVAVRQNPRFNQQPLVIGWKHGGTGPDHFLGWIDELRLYNRALTLAEVQALAQPAATTGR